MKDWQSSQSCGLAKSWITGLKANTESVAGQVVLGLLLGYVLHGLCLKTK